MYSTAIDLTERTLHTRYFRLSYTVWFELISPLVQALVGNSIYDFTGI